MIFPICILLALRLDVHTILLEIEVKIIFETRNPIQNQFKLIGRRRGRS